MNNQLSLSITFRIILIIGLRIAIADLPYDYYTFLRWIVCAGCIYSAYVSTRIEKRFWIIIFALIALLFNPIAPIFLDKTIWVVIDIVAAILFIASLFLMRKKETDKLENS